jgi:hypothetical protein
MFIRITEGVSVAPQISPDAVADFPLAYRLATLAWNVNPSYANGGLSSLMGSFESAQPGGSLAKATQYFDEAITISQGKNAGAYIAKAEGIALPQNQREDFEILLKSAIKTSDKYPDLSNNVMRERALWLSALGVPFYVSGMMITAFAVRTLPMIVEAGR